MTTEIKRFDQSFNNMRKNLKNAGFELIVKTGYFEIWIIPKTGRLLMMGTAPKCVQQRVTSKGGVYMPYTTKIEAVIHQLNSDEHYLIDKML